MPVPRIEFRLATTLVAHGVTTPVTVVIEQPVRWDQVEITAKRDAKYHGFNYEYSNGKVQVEFMCESAGDLLRAQYFQFGNDAVVKFLIVDIAADETETLRYGGKIDFSEVELQPGKVLAEIVRDELGEKIKAREDTPVSMVLTKTLDNSAINPPATLELGLPGQSIKEKGVFKRNGPFYESTEFDKPDSGPYTVFPNLVAPTDTPAPMGVIDPTTGLIIPADADIGTLDGVYTPNGGAIYGNAEDNQFIRCDQAGTYTLLADWIYKMNLTVYKVAVHIGSAKLQSWSIRPVLVIARPNEAIEVITLCPPILGNNTKDETGDQFISGHYNGTFQVTQGTRVYLQTQVLVILAYTRKLIIDVTTLSIRVELERVTRAADSKGQAYSLPDALRHVFGVISNSLMGGTGSIGGGLLSKASGSQAMDGYGTEYAVASGSQLRNLNNKPPTFNWKQLIGTLWAQHVAGLLFETDADGNHSVRVEEGVWFYRGGQIGTFTEVLGYSEKPAVDMLANQIVVGYEKFPDSGPGVLQEFNTTRTYQTPIVNHQLTKEIKCPLIAAGTAIEEARRLGVPYYDANGKLIDRSTEGGTYDDDAFLLHVEPNVLVNMAQFYAYTFAGFSGIPTVFYLFSLFNKDPRRRDTPVLHIGETITINGTGTANDGKTLVILGTYEPTSYVGFNAGLTSLGYWVSTPLTPSGPVPITWTNARQPAKIRTNERLNVTGITEPETAYNLELSPARMLRRHAPFLNSGFRYKQQIDELRCTDYQGNRLMTTRVKTGMGPLPGDDDRQRIRETGNIALGEFGRFEKLFSPEVVTTKVYMSKEEFDGMMLALRNLHPDESVNMGYISIVNSEDGSTVDLFPDNINFSPTDSVCDIVGRKRFVDQNPGGALCQDYPDFVFRQFEQDKTIDPNKYRFCRFSDFQ